MSRPKRDLIGPDGLIECRHCHKRKVPEMFRVIHDKRYENCIYRINICGPCELDEQKARNLARRQAKQQRWTWPRKGSVSR